MMTMSVSGEETERLILRRFRESDLQDLHEFLSDPEVVAYEPYKPMTMEEAKENLAWRISTAEMVAVELKATCARRELQEETGIESGALTKIARFVSHDTINENFLCITACQKDSVKLQEGETVSCKWISEAEFIGFVNSDAMIDVQYQRCEPYLRQMGYIK